MYMMILKKKKRLRETNTMFKLNLVVILITTRTYNKRKWIGINSRMARSVAEAEPFEGIIKL